MRKLFSGQLFKQRSIYTSFITYNNIMSEQKSTVRRDELIDIENKIQKKWDKAKIYEIDAPNDGTTNKDSYLVTFPYPYMNGVLHLGHGFTLAKAEFTARYQRLKGKTVLFPFGFHCTGMPIAACADKLRDEIEKYGNPPEFPVENDMGDKIDAKKKKTKQKLAKKKSKHKFQWQIMQEMGVPEAEIHKFASALHWLQYFPPIAMKDLGKFGLAADFRRSFITTEINPYYDAFIRWQFRKLHLKDKLKFGKRLSVYDWKNQQPCADHDRASGEGVNPQEYTLIKIRLTAPLPTALSSLEGRNVYVVAATLRPETMYGQTNCFVLPDGNYGAYEMKNDEVYVCSERSALNMSFQNMTKDEGKFVELCKCTGWDLLGHKVKAPLTPYEYVYILPLLTIKMSKGTGIVTSVPSDAPDDYAALMDLKRKPEMRAKFKLTDEMVVPFDVIPIINIPDFGDTAAATLCDERKVQSQNDAKKLAAIKEEVYLKGFYHGKMLVGEHAGMSVEAAKPVIRKELIDAGEADSYAEPEDTVIARSGVECVVAYTDQWYIPYGEEEWKALVKNHVNNTLETYSPATKKKFQEIVEWLHEWACSRSYGLGTKLPADEEYLIESLSDSTIYMSYYTIAYLLQGGVLDGSTVGPANIKPEELNDNVFDYIFLSAAYPENCTIPKETLDRMRHEFEYWYPVNLRVSGKDLIGNHLTMSLYNHAAIWQDKPDMWPRSFFTNGHLQINNEKMSKSTGNFMTMNDAISKFGTDATRIGLADAGDGLMDANFDEKVVNAAILRLSNELLWVQQTIETLQLLEDGNVEGDELQADIFTNEMNRCIKHCTTAYDELKFHFALIYGHHNLLSARDTYRANVDVMNKNLIMMYIRTFAILLSPICPHFTQHIWELIGEKGFIVDAKWPIAATEDRLLTQKAAYMSLLSHEIVVAYKQHTSQKGKKKKKKNDDASAAEATPPKPNVIDIYVSTKWPEAYEKALELIKQMQAESNAFPDAKDVLKVAGKFLKSKRDRGSLMSFVNTVRREIEENGSFEASTAFDETKLLEENISCIIRGAVGLEKGRVFHIDNPEGTYDRKAGAMPGKPVFNFHYMEISE